MHESFELFVIVSAIYLYECAQWVPAATAAFGALVPGRWRRRAPWRPSSRWQRGAAIGTPWPPLTPTFVAEPLPLHPGPQGVAAADGSRFIAWEQVSRVAAVDRRVELDGVEWARTATRRLAVSLAESLAPLPSLPPAARGKRIGKLLDARLQRETVRERHAAFRRDTRWLAGTTNLLWIGIFAGLPVLLWTPLAHWWIELLGVILLGWVLTAVAFARALRRSEALPRALWPDRAHRVLVYASPLSAVRARDLFARELLGDVDPLCAAAVLQRGPGFSEQARRALARLVYAEDGPAAAGTAQQEDARWLRDAQRTRIERLLTAAGLDAAGLLRAPAREDEQRSAYCPLCRTQYAHGERCANEECGATRLERFG